MKRAAISIAIAAAIAASLVAFYLFMWVGFITSDMEGGYLRSWLVTRGVPVPPRDLLRGDAVEGV